MTSKRAIKKLMSVGVPRNIARMWLDVGTALRITNEEMALLVSKCEGVNTAKEDAE